MSTNACDTKVSMAFNLLLARTRILPCFFFLFLVVLNSFLIIPVDNEKIKVKLALVIPTGAPITLAKEIIDTHPCVAERTIIILSM